MTSVNKVIIGPKEKCFFKPTLAADGKPYTYSLHKTGRIKGGTYPMGSVSYHTKYIEIPRSKYAKKVHLTALGIKVLTVVVLPMLLYMGLELNNQPVLLLMLFGSGVLTGFVLVYGLYWKSKVKPIFRHARTFPEVQKYLKKGYATGPHAMITSTPVGLVYHLVRWVF